MIDKASRNKRPINHKSIERWENEGGARKKRPRDAKMTAEQRTRAARKAAMSRWKAR